MLEGDGQYKYLVKYKLTAEHLGREVDEINNSNHNTCYDTHGYSFSSGEEINLLKLNHTSILFHSLNSQLFLLVEKNDSNSSTLFYFNSRPLICFVLHNN